MGIVANFQTPYFPAKNLLVLWASESWWKHILANDQKGRTPDCHIISRKPPPSSSQGNCRPQWTNIWICLYASNSSCLHATVCFQEAASEVDCPLRITSRAKLCCTEQRTGYFRIASSNHSVIWMFEHFPLEAAAPVIGMVIYGILPLETKAAPNNQSNSLNLGESPPTSQEVPS